MNKIWQNNYTLRAGDFDCFDRIKPSAVLDLFQDVAGQHAEELGVGFSAMLEKNYLWVLTRVKFKILSQPQRYQKVTVKTWPLEPNRLNYRREYSIKDQNGNLIIVGSSEWVVVHSKERRFLSVPDLYSFDDGFCEERSFDGKIGKIHDFEVIGEPYTITPAFCEIDINGHVNNTKYADFFLDALTPVKNDCITDFQIDYKKEVLNGTELKIYCQKDEKTAVSKGINPDGQIAFLCKADFL